MKTNREISLDLVGEKLGSRDLKYRKVRTWCDTYKVSIYPPFTVKSKNRFVYEDEFNSAFQLYLSSLNKECDNELVSNNQTINTSDMKKDITLKKPITGLFLSCKCRTKPLYKSEKAIKCNCTEFYYTVKLNVPSMFSEGKKKTKSKRLTANNINDAVIELSELKKQMATKGTFDSVREINGEEDYAKDFACQLGEQKSEPSLLDAIDFYLYFLGGEGGLRTGADMDYISEVRRVLHLFLYVVKRHTVNVSEIKFSSINSKKYSLLLTDFMGKDNSWIYDGKTFTTKKFAPSYYNKYLTIMWSFFHEIIERHQLNMINIWDSRYVERKKYEIEPVAFPSEQFPDLLKVISYENGWKILSKKRRNLYYSFLHNAFQLGFLTGGRRDIIRYAKWSDVNWIKGIPVILKVEKVKYNKQNKVDTHKFYWRIEIDEELESFLIKLGLNELKGSTDYIIAPEITNETTRENTIKRALTLSFPHFYSLLGTGEKYNFKQLRKMVATEKTAQLELGLIKELNFEHVKGSAVTKKHYEDVARKVLLKRQQVFQSQRREELCDILQLK